MRRNQIRHENARFTLEATRERNPLGRNRYKTHHFQGRRRQPRCAAALSIQAERGASWGKMSTANATKKIDRPIKICGEDRVVQQSWRPNGKGGYKLTSVLLKKGTQKPLNGALLAHVDEEEVATVAAQHAEEIRKRAEQKYRSGDAVPAPRKRGNAPTHRCSRPCGGRAKQGIKKERE